MGRLITKTVELACDACGAAAPPYVDGAEEDDDLEDDEEEADADDGFASALPPFWTCFTVEMRQPNPLLAQFEAKVAGIVQGAMQHMVPQARAQAQAKGDQFGVEQINSISDEVREEAIKHEGGYPSEFLIVKKTFVLCEKHTPLLSQAGVDVNLCLAPGSLSPWGAIGRIDPLDLEDEGPPPIDFGAVLAAAETQAPVVVPASVELPPTPDFPQAG